MLVHLRLTVPTELSPAVRDLVVGHDHCTNVVVHPGASLQPTGDLYELDVAREACNGLLDALTELGLDECGGIVLMTPAATPFDEAHRLSERAPGEPEDAVVWAAVRTAADAAAKWTASFQVFLILATILAAIAVVTDSPVLVVGAMVVGPEFAAVSAICTAIAFGHWSLAGRATYLLTVSFLVAIAVVTVLALIAVGGGLVTTELVTRDRPQTGFIWHPDAWSFIVALVAGAAGVLAQLTDKASALVGVFISVTTVPAAGNLALALATWSTAEMRGAGLQLLLNFAGMIVAGVVTLLIQRVLWARVPRFAANHRTRHPAHRTPGALR